MKIVIVEDESAIREGLKEMINGNTSHTVIGTCKNGIEGISFIQEHQPDLVITDIRMNQMGGLEMLAKLKKLGIEPLSIVISGYSEFEYARDALRLGVEEYLLKPVSIDALQELLEKIEQKAAKSSIQMVKKPENYVREYFFGTGEEQKEALLALKKIIPEEKNKIYGIFAGYFGNVKKEHLKEIEHPLRSIKYQFSALTCLDTWEESISFRILILKGSQSEIHDFTMAFDNMVKFDYQMQRQELPWGMDCCTQIENCKDCFENIKEMLVRCVSKGCFKLFSAGDFSEQEYREISYPIQADRKVLSALERGDYAQVKKEMDQFLQQIIREEYRAKEIRRAALKLVTRMMDMAKEINQKAYEKMKEQDYLKEVLLAYTKEELQRTLYQVGKLVCDKCKKEGISNYTINRTLEYVETHFKEGITLEKTAEVLNITPEYLSTLFKREMGMNFSVFLKEFRMKQAKRLLKSTNLKIYEIAQECGYSNSNYFTKVFKEVTGISPAEYR